ASASASAMKAPVMAAVRVPPSAWITSQSSHTVRSPSLPRFTTARSARPTSRWISCERPLGPRFSRVLRVLVERGSIAYSAVTQPSCWPLRNGGTLSSTEAVQITLVTPNSTSTEPSGCTRKSRVITTGRSASGARPSARDAQRLGHRILHDLRQPRRFFLELRLGQVPQDRLHDVGAPTPRRRLLELDHAVLERGHLARPVVGRLRRQEVGLDALGGDL